MSHSISIKGTREGLTITLGEGEPEALLSELEHHLATQGAFFRGALVALQVGGLPLDVASLTRARDLFAAHGMVLRTVMAAHPATLRAAEELGLRVLAEWPAAEQAAGGTPVADGQPEARAAAAPAVRAAPPRPYEGSRGVLVRRVVRSGQVLRHTGHVVVVGDVNAGAEISAGGDVVVWGRLRGAVQAGALGDADAVVCALELAPTQLCIGPVMARGDAPPRRGSPVPEVARVREGQIVVEPWDRRPREW